MCLICGIYGLFMVFAGIFGVWVLEVSRGKGSFSSKAGYFCIHAATQGHFVAAPS